MIMHSCRLTSDLCLQCVFLCFAGPCHGVSYRWAPRQRWCLLRITDNIVHLLSHFMSCEFNGLSLPVGGSKISGLEVSRSADACLFDYRDVFGGNYDLPGIQCFLIFYLFAHCTLLTRQEWCTLGTAFDPNSKVSVVCYLIKGNKSFFLSGLLLPTRTHTLPFL